ncbi:tyrosine-type recombinase/integrase [Paludibaculum fermentans]|uniref:tyrosine-type recombinase/integrase n=1 Tax=Paludibaculum fermentans TaxID=1473598 RepID=UPI003EBA6C28
MAIPLGTNDLKIFRRHLTDCRRYPGVKNKPFSYRPRNAQEKKTDTCECPIWCYGYLAKETRTVDGRTKPKRVGPNSIGVNDWAAAEREVAALYERGSLPPVQTAARPIDNNAITVQYAGKRYLESRKNGLNPIEQDTYDHDESLMHDRLFPYCQANGIVYIRDFENRDVCNQFTESWRKLRRNPGDPLAITTRKIVLQRFRKFLSECVENEWMKKSGADKIRIAKPPTAAEEERYGLELDEYERLMSAPDSPGLTQLENVETRVATELMRWTGMRISDAHKFNDAEVVPNEKGDGWNADFIQKKTKKRCVTPLPEHVKVQLHALPGRTEAGKKFFFTCSYTALRMRVDTFAERAQKEQPFKHPFSPHCLRHTFAIQHIHQGTDMKFISKWLGHESVSVTHEHYGNWIGTTKKIAADANREANDRMLAAAAEIRRQMNSERTNSTATPLGTL